MRSVVLGSFNQRGSIAKGAVGPFAYSAGLVKSITNHSTGKFYFEMSVDVAAVLADVAIGIDNGNEVLVLPGGQTGGIAWLGDGTVNYNGLSNVYQAAPFVAGGTYGVAVDLTNGKIYFTPNGTLWNINGLASPAGNVGGFLISAIGGSVWAMAQLSQTNDQITANFTGSGPSFAYSAPAGFSAWG